MRNDPLFSEINSIINLPKLSEVNKLLESSQDILKDLSEDNIPQFQSFLESLKKFDEKDVTKALQRLKYDNSKIKLILGALNMVAEETELDENYEDSKLDEESLESQIESLISQFVLAKALKEGRLTEDKAPATVKALAQNSTYDELNEGLSQFGKLPKMRGGGVKLTDDAKRILDKVYKMISNVVSSPNDKLKSDIDLKIYRDKVFDYVINKLVALKFQMKEDVEYLELTEDADFDLNWTQYDEDVFAKEFDKIEHLIAEGFSEDEAVALVSENLEESKSELDVSHLDRRDKEKFKSELEDSGLKMGKDFYVKGNDAWITWSAFGVTQALVLHKYSVDEVELVESLNEGKKISGGWELVEKLGNLTQYSDNKKTKEVDTVEVWVAYRKLYDLLSVIFVKSGKRVLAKYNHDKLGGTPIEHTLKWKGLIALTSGHGSKDAIFVDWTPQLASAVKKVDEDKIRDKNGWEIEDLDDFDEETNLQEKKMTAKAKREAAKYRKKNKLKLKKYYKKRNKKLKAGTLKVKPSKSRAIKKARKKPGFSESYREDFESVDESQQDLVKSLGPILKSLRKVSSDKWYASLKPLTSKEESFINMVAIDKIPSGDAKDPFIFPKELVEKYRGMLVTLIKKGYIIKRGARQKLDISMPKGVDMQFFLGDPAKVYLGKKYGLIDDNHELKEAKAK